MSSLLPKSDLSEISIQKPQRLILAPLLGITTATFRSVYSRHFVGFDCAMAPFIPFSPGKPPALHHFRDIWPQNNQNSLPLIPQLIGKDGLTFRDTANRIHEEYGYTEVNWNIGCPSRTVTSRLRGAGMLAHPGMIDSFLEQACTGLQIGLSVKLRLGMESADEFLALAPILNRYPISEITIHPRTGRQQYTGRADVEKFAQFKNLLVHPLVYNGDLKTTEQARGIAKRFSDLSGIMLGRGALTNPWLPRAIKEGRDEKELFSLVALKSFHDELLATYVGTMQGGPHVVLGKMKELWSYWTPVIPGGERSIRRVLKSQTLREFNDQAEKAFVP